MHKLSTATWAATSKPEVIDDVDTYQQPSQWLAANHSPQVLQCDNQPLRGIYQIEVVPVSSS